MTRAERRLDKVEASLSPTALVVRWLEEAHAYDDFTAYTASLPNGGVPFRLTAWPTRRRRAPTSRSVD